MIVLLNWCAFCFSVRLNGEVKTVRVLSTNIPSFGPPCTVGSHKQIGPIWQKSTTLSPG